MKIFVLVVVVSSSEVGSESWIHLVRDGSLSRIRTMVVVRLQVPRTGAKDPEGLRIQ